MQEFGVGISCVQQHVGVDNEYAAALPLRQGFVFGVEFGLVQDAAIAPRNSRYG